MFHHAGHASSISKAHHLPSHNSFHIQHYKPCCLHATNRQCLQAGQPERQPSDAYDGYEASLSERHSDATSDTTQAEAAPHPHQPLGRSLTLSPSMRSSAASTDDLLSPTLAQHFTHGFTHSAVGHQPVVPTDVQSPFTGPALPHLPAGQQSDLQTSHNGSAAPAFGEGEPGHRSQWGLLGGRLQAGFGHIGQSLAGGVFNHEPHQRTLSPELGVYHMGCPCYLQSACNGGLAVAAVGLTQYTTCAVVALSCVSILSCCITSH